MITRLFTQSIVRPLARTINRVVSTWNPSLLFAANEQGLIYDFNDLSTMFQDSAGTTPVTAAGQPVGLVLDKSKGLVLGPELVSNGDFSAGTTTGWTSFSSTLDASSFNLLITNTTTTEGLAITGAVVSGRWYEVNVNVIQASNSGAIIVGGNRLGLGGVGVKRITVQATSNTDIRFGTNSTTVGHTLRIDNISVRELPGNHALQATAASRPILRQSPILGPELVTGNWNLSGLTDWSYSAGALTKSGITAGGGPSQVETTPFVPGSAYRISYRITALSSGLFTIQLNGGTSVTGTYRSSVGTYEEVLVAGGGNQLIRVVANAASAQGTLDNISVREITGYYTDRNYLEFDGVDDFLQTNSIDFSSTDKVSVFAGVRKLSDAAIGVICELSANVNTNSGSFNLLAPGGIGLPNYVTNTNGGSAAGRVVTTFTAPISNVLSATLNNAVNSSVTGVIVRVNGAIPTTSGSGATGTGNYGNYPIYIGRRGGSSLPFKGYLYSLVIVGKLASDSEISNTERYIAPKVGVTLP